MNNNLGLVLDANILLRAVFGSRVLPILERHEDSTPFYCPDNCLQEAQRNLPVIATRRGFDTEQAYSILTRVGDMVERIDLNAYSAFRELAMLRIGRRDPDDWPVVAVSLMLQLPIWTEDLDFFGIGIAIWKSELVELYFRP